jgi:4-amino-4-deoxy-L-arabinose transferase-like glycosyltransferase
MKNYSIFEKAGWVSALAILALFASIRVIGLQPDAALYAGLAQKILQTGEAWMISASAEKFPKFFEHPPYFFQWGAWLMSRVGVHEWSAKAMGALPALVAVFMLTIFTWKNWGWSVAAWTVFALTTTLHFTKYASTSMMEGPLALGVLLAALGCYVYLYASRNYVQLGGVLMMGAGIALACAIKGVIGLGAWGGCLLAVVGHFFLENKPLSRLFFVPFLGLSLFFFGALPFLYWLLQAVKQPALFEWLHGYFVKQVFRSATTDRGEEFFREAQNFFYYFEVILKNLWPWWWAVPLTLILAFRGKERFRDKALVRWILVSGSFFSAFIVPLSLISYKLPHYLHPTYLVLAPLAGFSLDFLGRTYVLPRLPWMASPWVRWIPLFAAVAFVIGRGEKISSTENRGQEFIAIRERVNNAPARCRVLVPRPTIDVYRMEAFALWYFEGREWAFTDERLPSRIAVPSNSIYWVPPQGLIWASEECQKR